MQYTSYAPSGENTVFAAQPTEVYTGASPVANCKPDAMINQDAGVVSGIHGGGGATISLEDLAAVCSQDIGDVQNNSPVTVQAIADSTTDNRTRGKGVNVDTDSGPHDQAPVTVMYEYDPSAYSGQQIEPHQQVVAELPNSCEQIFLVENGGSTFIVQGDAAMPVSSVQSSQEGVYDNGMACTDPKDIRQTNTNQNDNALHTEVAKLAKPAVVKTTVRAAPKKTVPVTKPPLKRKEPDTCGLLSDTTPRPVPHAPKPVPGVSSFQNSFLSFLQGGRQETLSSVTTRAPGKKPVLPKYVPVPKSTVKSESSVEVKPKNTVEMKPKTSVVKPVDAKAPVISSDHSSTSSPVPTAKKVDDMSAVDSDQSSAALSTPKTLPVSTRVATGSSAAKSPRRGRPAKRPRGRPKKTAPVSEEEISNSGEEAEEVEVAPPVVRPARPVRKARQKIETKPSVVKTKSKYLFQTRLSQMYAKLNKCIILPMANPV